MTPGSPTDRQAISYPDPVSLKRHAGLVGLVLATGFFLGSAAAMRDPPLPPIEPWGNLRRPYGDSLAAVARQAIGPRAPEYVLEDASISLEEFFSLGMTAREIRERQAEGLHQRALILKKTAGIDSLGFYLEVLHTAPAFIPSYEQAVRILLERGATARAHPLAVQAIRLDPGNDVLWTLLAQAYSQGGDRRKARFALEHALRLGGASNRRLPNVVEVLATLYVGDGDLAQADSLLDANAESSAPWLTQYVRAQEARRNGDTATARQNLREAANQSQAPAAIFIELGSMEQELGNLDAAEQAYSHALRLAPQEAAAHTGLGLVQLARGDSRGAAARFERRVLANPRDYTAHFNLGRALLGLAAAQESPAQTDSAYGRAETCFSVCIQARYQAEGAHLARAQARWGRGNLDGAEEDARRVLDSPAHTARARLVIARVALTQGRPGETVAQLQPLQQQGSLDAAGLAMLGKAYLELDEPEPAVAALERAHALAPGEAHVAMNYGVALSLAGRLVQAEALFRELLQQQPANPDVLQNLAAVLQRQGRSQEAEAALREAERLRLR